jgi:hypothetical protein
MLKCVRSMSLIFNAMRRFKRRRAMFGNVRHSSPFDAILIDDRNERPLTVALVTIIMVWSFAFVLTFASGHTGANSASWLGGAAAVTPSVGK